MEIKHNEGEHFSASKFSHLTEKQIDFDGPEIFRERLTDLIERLNELRDFKIVSGIKFIAWPLFLAEHVTYERTLEESLQAQAALFTNPSSSESSQLAKSLRKKLDDNFDGGSLKKPLLYQRSRSYAFDACRVDVSPKMLRLLSYAQLKSPETYERALNFFANRIIKELDG